MKLNHLKVFELLSQIITILACIYLFSYQSVKLPTFYKFLRDNWKKDPIIDIQLAQSDSCTTIGDPFYNYIFPGTYESCQCNTQIITVGCSVEQISNGCSTLREIPAYVLEKWKIEGSTYQLCVQRLSNYNYFSHYNKYQRKCNSDSEITCGGSDISTQICVDKSVNKCPLTSIKFQSAQPSADYTQSITQGSNALYLSRSTEERSITETNVQEGNGVCLDLNQNNITPGREDYKLFKKLKSYCSKLDSRFQYVQSIGEINLLQANDLYTQVSALPFFAISNSYLYNLYYRSYIQWNGTCKGHKIWFFTNLSSIFKAFNICELIILIVNPIWLAFELKMHIFHLKYFKRKVYPHSKSFAQEISKFKPIIKSLSLKFIPAIYTISLLFLGYTLYIFSMLYMMQSQKCSDDLTNSQIGDYKMDFLYQNLIPVSIIAIFVIFSGVFRMYELRKFDVLYNVSNFVTKKIHVIEINKKELSECGQDKKVKGEGGEEQNAEEGEEDEEQRQHTCKSQLSSLNTQEINLIPPTKNRTRKYKKSQQQTETALSKETESNSQDAMHRNSSERSLIPSKVHLPDEESKQIPLSHSSKKKFDAIPELVDEDKSQAFDGSPKRDEKKACTISESQLLQSTDEKKSTNQNQRKKTTPISQFQGQNSPKLLTFADTINETTQNLQFSPNKGQGVIYLKDVQVNDSAQYLMTNNTNQKTQNSNLEEITSQLKSQHYRHPSNSINEPDHINQNVKKKNK